MRKTSLLLFSFITFSRAWGVEYTWTTLAGKLGGQGNADGIGSAARFLYCRGAALDGSGNFYAADTNNHTIRKITAAGAVTTLAGKAEVFGSANGTGAAARFSSPQDLAVDSKGNVYVADTGNHSIRKITPAGVVSTLAGSPASTGSHDGTGPGASFNMPVGLGMDAADNLYVVGDSLVRKITPAGVVSTLAGHIGFAYDQDGQGLEAGFNDPSDVAADKEGNLYVVEQRGRTLRKITPGLMVSTLAGQEETTGSTDGPGSEARFNYPTSVGVDGDGNIYVADTYNHTIRKITPGGMVSTLAGLAGMVSHVDGSGAEARFESPASLAVDSGGNLSLTDFLTIRRITPAGVVSTVAGLAESTGSADGSGAEARFWAPTGVVVDAGGRLHVTDSGNSLIRRISPEGTVSTLAGSPGAAGITDGTGAQAGFNFPGGLTLDKSGNLFIADTFNKTIRKVTPEGVVTTIAGYPKSGGSTDGTGAAALFSEPSRIAVNGSGDLYVTDLFNCTIRKVTAGGLVTTFAGKTGVTGSTNGNGTAARFKYPEGVVVDAGEFLYVTDTGNHLIRKITPGGGVTTLAGQAGSAGSTDGTLGAARFNSPSGIAMDADKNLYVSDYSNNTIRKITAAGVVSTIGGKTGVAGGLDGTGAMAQFSSPAGLAVDGNGNVYVADSKNNAIRKGWPGPLLSGIELWRQTYFGSTVNSGAAANNSDADGDGLVNLLEFACGLNPRLADPVPLSLAVDEDSLLDFRFSRSSSAVSFGAVFSVEWSDDPSAPGSWKTDGVNQQILSDDGTTQLVKAMVPGGSATRRFCRLRVSSPPE